MPRRTRPGAAVSRNGPFIGTPAARHFRAFGVVDVTYRRGWMSRHDPVVSMDFQFGRVDAYVRGGVVVKPDDVRDS